MHEWNEMELDGLRRVASKNFNFYCTHELMRARGKCFFLKKKSDCNPALPDLSLHVEKYRYLTVALLSFLQLQPPTKKPSPSPS